MVLLLQGPRKPLFIDVGLQASSLGFSSPPSFAPSFSLFLPVALLLRHVLSHFSPLSTSFFYFLLLQYSPSTLSTHYRYFGSRSYCGLTMVRFTHVSKKVCLLALHVYMNGKSLKLVDADLVDPKLVGLLIPDS